MGIAYRQVEREVYPAHPIFQFWCRIYSEIVGTDYIFSQSGKFLRQIFHLGQLRVHRTEITLYSTFETQGDAIYVESVRRALMGIESVVGDMLPE